jgi:hypothetical protein
LSKDIFSIIKRYNDLQNVRPGLQQKRKVEKGAENFTVLREENFIASMDFEENLGKSMKTVQYLYTIYKLSLSF